MTTILENPDNLLLGDEGDNLLEGTTVGVIDGLEGDDTILGVLNANEPSSTLFGNAGDDYIRSRGLGDIAFGDPGDDTLVNENGQGLMFGNPGNDYLISRESGATLFGGSDMEDSPDDGDNILISEGGENILVGGGGSDTLVGVVGGDTIAGRGGNDNITGGPEGNNFLFGNTGLDSLLSLSIERPDSLYGGQDDDQVAVGSDSTADNPILGGGLGSDSLAVQGSQVDGAILIGDAFFLGGDYRSASEAYFTALEEVDVYTGLELGNPLGLKIVVPEGVELKPHSTTVPRDDLHRRVEPQSVQSTGIDSRLAVSHAKSSVPQEPGLREERFPRNDP